MKDIKMHLRMYIFGILLLIVSTPVFGEEVTMMSTIIMETTRAVFTTQDNAYETTGEMEATTGRNDGTTVIDVTTFHQVTTDTTNSCGDSAYSLNGQCYFIAPQRTDCQRVGGNLAKLEPNSIYNGLLDIYAQTGLNDVWIGLTNINNPSEHEWSLDNSIPTETNWDTNEPLLQCAYVVSSTGKWKTLACESDIEAICQISEIEYTDAIRSLSLETNASSSNPDIGPQKPPDKTQCVKTYGCVGDNIFCDLNDGCLCSDGFQYADNKNNSCIENLTCAVNGYSCQENAECIIERSSPRCQCKDGYTITLDDVCEVINFCEEGKHNCDQVPHTQCVPTEGSFVCACMYGYEMDVSVGFCRIIDECNIDGATCPSPEEHCTRGDRGFVCECSSGYTRNPGTAECENINECEIDNNPCQEIRNTKCVDVTPVQDSNLFYRCECKDGYVPEAEKGGHCERVTEDALCVVVECQNDGSCSSIDNGDIKTAICSCLDGFEGDKCQITRPTGINADSQSNGQEFLIVGLVTASMLFLLLVVISCCAYHFFGRNVPRTSPSVYSYTRPMNPYVVRNKVLLDRKSLDWRRQWEFDDKTILKRGTDLERATDALDEMRIEHFEKIFKNNSMKNVDADNSNFGFVLDHDGSETADFTLPYNTDGSINA